MEEEAARLAASERMSPEELRYLQEGYLRERLLFCLESVEAYRPYWQQRKLAGTDPGAVLGQLPPLTRAAYRRNPAAYTDERAKARRPDTLAPGRFTHQDVLWRRFLGWHGIAPGSKRVVLAGLPPLCHPAGHAVQWLRLRTGGAFVLDAFALYPDALPLKALASFKPAYVYALGAAYEAVADRIAGALGAQLPVFVTGDTPPDKPLGFPVYETGVHGLIASACPEAGNLHIHAERFWVEILKTDPENEGKPVPPGQPGYIAVTDLSADAAPRLRYVSGDIAALSDTPCPCGRGLPVLTGLQGRREAMLCCPDGKLVHGRALDMLRKPYPGVARFQLTQTGPAYAILSVQRRGGAPLEESQAFHADVSKLLDGIQIELRMTDSCPGGLTRLPHTVAQFQT